MESSAPVEVIQAIVRGKDSDALARWLEEFLVNSVQPLYALIGPFDPFIPVPKDYLGGGDLLTDVLRASDLEPDILLLFGNACLQIIDQSSKRLEGGNAICLQEALLFFEGLPVSTPDKAISSLAELWDCSEVQERENLANQILLDLGGLLQQCANPRQYITLLQKIETQIELYPTPAMCCILLLDWRRALELLPAAVRAITQKSLPVEYLLFSLKSIAPQLPEGKQLTVELGELIGSRGWISA